MIGIGTGRPYVDPVGRPGLSGSHPPIYAQLVAEWRAEGRGVPEPREVLWATFAAPVPEAESGGSVPAVPVPRGLTGW
ncbi:hypothetical protein [Streptomyces sp. NBC_00645]|uniref:hypothetical protein n=1 Tax=Streptomyces sp. NBC_00645 TaxID=2975795 RepID=UPI0032510278